MRRVWTGLAVAALAALVCVDDAQAGLIFGRRNRGNDCCYSSYSGGCGYGGYGYGGGCSSCGGGGYGGGYVMYGGGGCGCGQSTGYAYGSPMYGGYQAMYGESNMYGGQQYGGQQYGGQPPMYNGGQYGVMYGGGQQFSGGQIAVPATGPLAHDRARLHIQVPSPDTRLWVDNQQIMIPGPTRTFDVMATGQNQKVTLTAQWNQGGRDIVRKKEVQLQPGQEQNISFNEGDNQGQPGQPGQPGTQPGQPGHPGEQPGQPGGQPGQPGQPGGQPGNG